MTLLEIKKRLKKLYEAGFVVTERKGSTGIGHTLEKSLELSETNIAIPDIGGRVELKASRKSTASLITLFTFNQAVWQVPQKEVIEKFGYFDVKNNRWALYQTLYVNQEHSNGLSLSVDKEKNTINITHEPFGTIIASWSVFTIVGKFITKLENAIVVLAECKVDPFSSKEMFHFNEAYLLKKPSPDRFLEAFNQGLIAIDIRMHINERGSVRNHGTGIRCLEKNIITLYDNQIPLIP